MFNINGADIIIILWGAPVKIASENIQIQELIKDTQREGVHVSAYKACADQLGVVEA